VESGSPLGGESQSGQVPLHRTRQGLMPPVKSRPGGFTRLSRIILAESLDGLDTKLEDANLEDMKLEELAHTKGDEGNLSAGTQIRSLRMPGPLDGAPDAPTTGDPFYHFIPRSG
jgi:hypothetical protein